MTETANQEPEETGPLRTCVATRKRLAPEQMLRLVLDPSGQRVYIDYLHKLPGRGAYVCADRDSLRKAVEKGGIKKAFRAPVIADAETLLQEAAEAANRHLSSLLALGLRAGVIAAGNSRVEHTLRQGSALLMLIAMDAAPSISTKFSRWAARLSIPCLQTFPKDVLGSPLRLPSCSLLTVTESGFATTLQREAIRAQGFLPPMPPPAKDHTQKEYTQDQNADADTSPLPDSPPPNDHKP